MRSRGRREGTSLRKRLSCESGPARVVSGPAIELEATKAEVRGSDTARSSSIIPMSERKLEDTNINSQRFGTSGQPCQAWQSHRSFRSQRAAHAHRRTAYRHCLSRARARTRAEQDPSG